MATKQGRFQFFTSVMWRNNKFLHNCQDFTILHICHVEKSEIPLHLSDFSPFAMYRNLKFLHMTDFSPHVSHMNYVTNMRYAQSAVLQYFQKKIGRLGPPVLQYFFWLA